MEFIMKHAKKTLRRLALVALTFMFSIPVTLALMLSRFKRMLNRGVPAAPAPGMEPPDDRNMEDVFSSLQKVPFEPVRPLAIGLARGALSMSYLFLLDTTRSTAGRVYPYPREFKEVEIESFDGAKLAAVAGIHADGRRPGLVVSHGYMGSKNDQYVVSIVLRAFSEWGFNVLAADLRDSGASMRLGFNPTTFGLRESEDLLACARYLGEQPGVTTVGLTGFSMGAVSTMRAAHMAREHPYLTGGAIAWNGVSDAARVIEHLDTRPPPSDPFFPMYLGFRLKHSLRRADMKRHVEDPATREFLQEPFSRYDFEGYLSRVSAPRYGITYDEILEKTSSKNFLSDLEVPLLVIHAADDPVCPVQEMDDLIVISEQNENLEVWILPTGMHCVFPYLDRNWFDTVMRKFFSYWATWE